MFTTGTCTIQAAEALCHAENHLLRSVSSLLPDIPFPFAVKQFASDIMTLHLC